MEDAGTILAKLLGGSEKFRMEEGHVERARHAKGHAPKAAVLYCSDAREVAEKLLGSEKRGEIFGIRLAGNVASSEAIGSIVYAVEHLHVPLVLVLGHTGCGAVAAAKKGGSHGDADLDGLISAVAPDEKRNLKAQVNRVALNPAIAKAVREGRLAVFGVLHDMESGEMRVMERFSANARVD